MLRLYEGSGSSELILGEQYLPSERWIILKQSACRLLRGRGSEVAAQFLEQIPFEVFEGTNGFGDEFQVLYWCAPFEKYMELADSVDEPLTRAACRQIANTITEVGPYIRFVAVSLDTDGGPVAVPPPTLRTTSAVVEAALADAEHLIKTRGAVSGLDRVHTALHGYVRAVADESGIAIARDASLTQLFKALQDGHPAFDNLVCRAEDIKRIIRALATIVDAVNPLRNRASLAHPNEDLLPEAEAMLVINTVRTLLHYLDARVQ